MERVEWSPGRAQLPPKLGGIEYLLDVCPGYIVRQDVVTEAAAAYAAFDKGAFDSFYPEPSNLLCESVQELGGALNRHQAEAFKASREKR
jgi:hypothetical protein